MPEELNDGITNEINSLEQQIQDKQSEIEAIYDRIDVLESEIEAISEDY